MNYYKVKTLRKGDEATGYRWESSPLIEAELQTPGNRLNGVSDPAGAWRVMALRDPMPDCLLDPNSYASGEAEIVAMSREAAKALSLSWVRTGRTTDPITGEDKGEWTFAEDVTAGMPE